MKRIILMACLLVFLGCGKNEAQESKAEVSVKKEAPAKVVSEKQAVASVDSNLTVDSTTNKAVVGPQPAAVAYKGTLLAFMNPNGRPCQIQDAIIKQNENGIRAIADIKPILTVTSEDRDLFQKYGVRALPTLIIIDTNGKEIHRFPPGIKDASQIFEELNKLN